MTWPIVLFVFALVVLVISLLVPGLRALTLNLLAALAWGLYGLSRRIFNQAPAWLAIAATWLGRAAVATGGFIATAAIVFAVILTAFTVVLVLAIVVASTTGSTWFLAALAVVLGSISFALYLAADWVNTLFRPTSPHVHSTGPHPPVAKPHSKDKLAAMGPLTRFFWLWSLLLFYFAFVVLFLPNFTTEITFNEICIVTLGAIILLIGGALGILAFVRFIAFTTGLATALILMTMLFGPADLIWTDLRFTNMDQKSIASTERRIRGIEHLRVRFGGLNAKHQQELNSLIGQKQQQKQAATESQERRENEDDGSESPSFYFHPLYLGVMLLGLAVLGFVSLPLLGRSSS